MKAPSWRRHSPNVMRASAPRPFQHRMISARRICPSITAEGFWLAASCAGAPTQEGEGGEAEDVATHAEALELELPPAESPIKVDNAMMDLAGAIAAEATGLVPVIDPASVPIRQGHRGRSASHRRRRRQLLNRCPLYNL